MNKPIKVRGEAERDIGEAYRWYAERGRGLAEEFLRALDAALASIGRHPQAYPAVFGDIRRALLRKFPYSVFYIEEPDAVVVIGCFHVRQDPRRWVARG
ncbi:MAG: type II toxin-antitoxin system RelE/ParE family toxin [Gemmatimonadota bacterium]